MEEVCKICDRVFGNKKALGGHMRVHFMFSKNTPGNVVDKLSNISEEHRETVYEKTSGVSCRECGKGFGTIRSLTGHMQVHSRKSRVFYDSETRKRRKIKHEGVRDSTREFYGLNEDCYVGSEVGEVEMAAKCLIMISTGGRLDLGVENSDDDGSDYFGGVNDSNVSLSCDVGDGFDCTLVARDETKVGFDTSVDLFRSIDVIKKEGVNEAPVKVHCGNELMESDSMWFTKLGTDMDDDVSAFVKSGKTGARAQNSGLERDYSENADKILAGVTKRDVSSRKNGVEGRVSLNSSKNKEYECPICFKVFSSGQAMGGHKRAHFTKSKPKEETYVKQEVEKIKDLIDLNFPLANEDAEADNQWWVIESSNGNTNCQVKSVA